MISVPPPAIVLNGYTLPSYNPPVIRDGRVLAPVLPYVTAVADSIRYSGNTMEVTRGDRFAEVTFVRVPVPGEFAQTYVPLAPLLRTLGLSVAYDPQRRRVLVTTPRAVLATPTPFNVAVPQATPRIVFTPEPVATPRPLVTGSPMPRRTPLPALAPYISNSARARSATPRSTPGSKGERSPADSTSERNGRSPPRAQSAM